jgi:hypothetical protein
MSARKSGSVRWSIDAQASANLSSQPPSFTGTAWHNNTAE